MRNITIWRHDAMSLKRQKREIRIIMFVKHTAIESARCPCNTSGFYWVFKQKTRLGTTQFSLKRPFRLVFDRFRKTVIQRTNVTGERHASKGSRALSIRFERSPAPTMMGGEKEVGVWSATPGITLVDTTEKITRFKYTAGPRCEGGFLTSADLYIFTFPPESSWTPSRPQPPTLRSACPAVVYGQTSGTASCPKCPSPCNTEKNK